MNLIELTAPIRERYRPEEAPVPVRCVIYNTNQMIEVSVNEHAYENGIMYLDRVTYYGLTVFDFDIDSGSMTYRSDLGGVFESAALCDEAIRRALQLGAMPDTRFLRQRYLEHALDLFADHVPVVFFGLDHHRILMLAYATNSYRYVLNVVDTVESSNIGLRIFRKVEDVKRFLNRISNYVGS